MELHGGGVESELGGATFTFRLREELTISRGGSSRC
jgi:hypothetical protein